MCNVLIGRPSYHRIKCRQMQYSAACDCIVLCLHHRPSNNIPAHIFHAKFRQTKTVVNYINIPNWENQRKINFQNIFELGHNSFGSASWTLACLGRVSVSNQHFQQISASKLSIWWTLTYFWHNLSLSIKSTCIRIDRLHGNIIFR